MKTFLETHRDRSKSFVLYGNVNDMIWCGDMSVRSLEQYLVRLLKSRKYEHIIFYGDAGTRGAYCLDPQSARFFFGDNQNIPLPVGANPLEEDAAETGTANAKTNAEKTLRAMVVPLSYSLMATA